MIQIAGGILLAVFILLVLVGLFLAIRDGARFAHRHAVTVALVLGLGAWVCLSWARDGAVEKAGSNVQCSGSCLYR